MSKRSSRPRREEFKAQRRERKQAQKELRRQQAAEGLRPRSRCSLANGTCEYETVEEERVARNSVVSEQAKVFRAQLPHLLRQLQRIPDPRNPKKIRHKHTVLIIYGILSFVFQMSSRREANRELTRPMFVENLKLLFPDLETIPHHDTLMRLLERIDVSALESAHIELLRQFIRKKKFLRYLIANCYPIAVDGSQKFKREIVWSEECLSRDVTYKDGVHTQGYVYVLEANLAFHNGMSIPLMSEFLSYSEGYNARDKQDCEQLAFRRLAARLKRQFPCLPIMVLLDGLYPNGPIMELCRKNKWQFMIVLQDGSLPSVWQEYGALKGLGGDNKHHRIWGDRQQQFEWVNDIEYYFGPNDRKTLAVHVVTCNEHWKEIDPKSNQVVVRRSRHAWISSEPLSRRNVHERCNLAARYRWGIEANFLVEKCCGYHYEHCLSYDWNAMRGYHYLMRLGHFFNVITQHTTRLVNMVKTLGKQGLIRFIRETIAAPWLDRELIQQWLAGPIQIRLE
jgi:hypothetical protein